MKYKLKTFNREVEEYSKILKTKVKGKIIFVVVDLMHKKAFYSLAPLSRAVHDLGGEMHAVVKEGRSENLQILKNVWRAYNDKKKKLKTLKTKALTGFINSVVKRTKNKNFEDIFKEPEIFLTSTPEGFCGTLKLKYRNRWHKRYRWNELIETAGVIWKQGYDLKKTDKVSIGFTLIPSEKNTELPLEDYLDSYSLARAMVEAAKKFRAEISLGASTDKFSILAKPVRVSDLMVMLKGCELDKEVDEEVFKKFKEFSKLLGICNLSHATAGFGIHGKGYHGKHFFGEEIGYPTLDKKTRWSSPGQMMLKDRYAPQSQFESRDPMMRYAVTETLPIDIFIETCNVNYEKLRKRSSKIKKILDNCDHIRVIGDQVGDYKTDFTVYLKKKDGSRREFIAKDSDVRKIVDQEYYKKTGKKYGTYANFPSGEAFVTPEKVEGIVIGDVVINIDGSYRIPEKSPIIVEIGDKGYKILKAPSKILNLMKKEWKESKEKIRNFEKKGSLPKEIINMYKKNFRKIGEFAINTNPKAKLCDYLIVNEKIARMIHIALGMGFDSDRATVYHWDIVIDSPKQKLDIYGIDKKKNIHWVIKKGKFAV
ncbi:hypothetical protein ISS05_00855 [Candidatus Woesearchaeota archaeon]|nr:hypothetical protein [Candidatus Woesearchaeota archaeon]